MANDNHRLRPAATAAGQSLSLADSAELIASLRAGYRDEDETQSNDQVYQAHVSQLVKDAITEAEQLNTADESQSTVYDVLFGPHSATFDAIAHHWAAWELYLLLDAATGEDGGLAGAIKNLHADNGYGYCTGCGTNETGIYLTSLADCPTLALLESS